MSEPSAPARVRETVDEHGVRRGPPRWLQGLVATLVSVVVIAAVWFVFVRGDDAPEAVRGLGSAAPDPFDSRGIILAGTDKAEFSETGRLMVIEAGQVTLAVGGELRGVTRPGTNVVDAAWFNGSEVMLVAEGPTPTGGISVIELDGTVRGTIPLEPSVGFGNGLGMSVAPGNRKAIVTVVERPTLAPADEWHLAEVDLETGKVRDITPPGDVNEFGPTYVDSQRVLYTERDKAMLLDLGTGEKKLVRDKARAVGVINGEWLVTVDAAQISARRLDDDGTLGRPLVLGDAPTASVVAVDPAGGRVVLTGVAIPPGATEPTGLGVMSIRPVPSSSG